MFRKLDALGYRGHVTTAFGTLQDMIEGREYLAAQGQKPDWPEPIGTGSGGGPNVAASRQRTAC
ncbi:MAG TPA: hypothetical protein VGX52_19585 [Burkholderiales bacterium]|nr:hypothetical protein [Burkholderiales bacterium]